MNDEFDLAVIGGGAAGLNVTSAASQLGQKVVLIEKHELLGGDCLHYGCVPSKSFIKSAKVAHLMRHGCQYGLSAQEPVVDMAKVTDRVQSIIQQIQVHDDPERFRGYGAEVLFGEGHFTSNKTFQFGTREIKAKRFVVATGTRPIHPPIPGLREANTITNETVFKLKTLPKTLFVLGAGFIGMELAQAFSRLGSKVIVVDARAELFPQLDRDIVKVWQAIYEKEGIRFLFNTTVLKVAQSGQDQTVVLKNHAGEEEHIDCELILIAAGRAPNTEGLQLEEAGVAYSHHGITVDARLRSSQKNIYAMGDVADCPYKFTHMAEYHAGIIIRNAVFRLPGKTDYRVVPSVVFSDPEYAMVGLSETQAKHEQISHEVLHFSFQDVDRALAESQTEGLAKVIVHKNKILGAQILGMNAGELISEFALAMQSNLGIRHISATIHAYPTLAQVNRRVVNTYYGPKLFNNRTRTLVKWLNRLLP